MAEAAMHAGARRAHLRIAEYHAQAAASEAVLEAMQASG
jgi:hypothetical protein